MTASSAVAKRRIQPYWNRYKRGEEARVKGENDRTLSFWSAGENRAGSLIRSAME